MSSSNAGTIRADDVTLLVGSKHLIFGLDALIFSSSYQRNIAVWKKGDLSAVPRHY